jgi:hypothetical protein
MKAPAEYPRTDLRYCERPIRLYDSKIKKCIPHRCFKFPVRALNVAAAIMNWVQPVRTIEVYNSNSGRLLGTFTKHADGKVSPWIDSTVPKGRA